MNTENTHLNDKQLHDLVTYITEDFGNDIDHDTFTTALLAMLENVAGLECLTDDEQSLLIDSAFKLYTQTPNGEMTCHLKKPLQSYLY